MKIPEATHWAFALRENGNLEIMSLPDLKVRYKIQNLNLAPNVLSDALNTAAIPTTQGNLLKGIDKKRVRRKGIEPVEMVFCYQNCSDLL